jgi:hypothetical protein
MHVAAIALVLLVVAVLIARPHAETMKSMSGASISEQAISELTQGKLRASEGSVTRIAITDVSIDRSQSGFAGRLFGGAPAHSVTLRARPKYYINGGSLVALGKRFEVRGSGESAEEAESDANREAAFVLEDVQTSLLRRGLMS